MICLLYLQKKDEKRYLHWSFDQRAGTNRQRKHRYNHLDWAHEGITPRHVVFQQLLAPSANTHGDEPYHKVMCYNCTEPQGGVPRTLKHLRHPGKLISMAFNAQMWNHGIKCLGINSISLLCPTQNASPPSLMNTEWMDLHLVPQFFCFFTQPDALKTNKQTKNL